MMKNYEEYIICSDLKKLLSVQEFIENVCSELNIFDHLGIISVATLEVVENSITHGNQLNPKKKVSIKFFKSNTTITFRIEDEGQGFDFKKYKTLPESGKKGKGLFLAHTLCKHLKFIENGRIVELQFPLTSMSAPDSLGRIKTMEQYFAFMGNQGRSSHQ